MGGVHVSHLATDDFADAAEIDRISSGIFCAEFFAEENIVAGNADGFAAELTDHVDEVWIDFLGQDAGDDIDRFVRGDAESADESGFKSGGFHRGGDRFSSAVDDDGIDAGDFQENDVAHDFGDQLRVFHGRSAHFDEEGFSAKRLKIR